MSCATASADYQKGLDAFSAGDYATAMRELSPLAVQGDASSQELLGAMYYIGLGTQKDVVYSMKWYGLAAKQGHTPAIEALLKIEVLEEQKARENRERITKGKYDRIYNACLLDKGVNVSNGSVIRALHEICKSIADDPSWLENFKYN